MRTIVRRACAAIVLGFLTSWAVALALALSLTVADGFSPADFYMADERIEIPRMYGGRRTIIMNSNRNDWLSNLKQDLPHYQDKPPVAPRHPLPAEHALYFKVVYEWGFPWTCLSYNVYYYMPDSVPLYETTTGFVLRQPGGAYAFPQENQIVPLRIHVSPLVGNALLYAGLWFLVISTPGTVVSVIRRIQVRCIRCGYRLIEGLASGCPECGWRRKAEGNPAALEETKDSSHV